LFLSSLQARRHPFSKDTSLLSGQNVHLIVVFMKKLLEHLELTSNHSLHILLYLFLSVHRNEAFHSFLGSSGHAFEKRVTF